MMSSRSRAFALSCLVLAACGLGPAGPGGRSAGDADVAVLFIGNSLTAANDLPYMLEELLEMGGIEDAVVEAVAFGNFGLEDHWARGDASSRIAEGGWDVVAMQQGPSATEGRPSLLQYSALYADQIRAVGAEPALYMVWPALIRFFDFDGVSDSYATAAAQVNGILFPAGEAWREAWAVDETLQLYAADDFHPSLLGTYLAALVMYEQLSGNRADGLPATIPTPAGNVALSADMALLLQTAAHEANVKFALSSVGSRRTPLR